MLGERTGTLDCDLCSAAKKADKSRTERPREATVDEMLGFSGSPAADCCRITVRNASTYEMHKPLRMLRDRLAGRAPTSALAADHDVMISLQVANNL